MPSVSRAKSDKVNYIMHWFKRNIGDYHKKAGRLTMLQHGAYTLLMDSCYDREQFPTKEDAIDWVWASTPEEIQAVEFVLSRFFTLEDGIYVQHRIAEEIDAYQTKSENNKRIAIEREAKRRHKRTTKHETCTNSSQVEDETPPNQEPITNNQEPRTKDKLDWSATQMSESEIKEIKRLRRVAKADVTQRVIGQLAKQFDLSRKRGFTNDDILNEWSIKGWRSYKDEWMKGAPSKKPVSQEQFETNASSELDQIMKGF